MVALVFKNNHSLKSYSHCLPIAFVQSVTGDCCCLLPPEALALAPQTVIDGACVGKPLRKRPVAESVWFRFELIAPFRCSMSFNVQIGPAYT